MVDYGGNEISDISRGWALCLLLLPITIIAIIWFTVIVPIAFGPIWVYGGLIIFVVILAIIGIPLLVDGEYRDRVIRRIRGETASPEMLFDPDTTNWNGSGAIQVWPTIRSKEGKPVSSRSHLNVSYLPRLSLPAIQQKIPELEEAVNELDAQVNAYSNGLEVSVLNQEQLRIERNAASQLLASLLIQRRKKTIAPQFYRRKRRRLLRTIKQIDFALDQTPKLKQTKADF